MVKRDNATEYSLFSWDGDIRGILCVKSDSAAERQLFLDQMDIATSFFFFEAANDKLSIMFWLIDGIDEVTACKQKPN